MKNKYIPASEPSQNRGELSELLEREVARFLGIKHAVFCNSGSSANLLAFMALTSPLHGSKAIHPGDEVITCAVNSPTLVAPIVQAGAIPVWVDITIGGYNTTPFMVSEAITDKTKAIYLSHTLGNPFDAQKIRDIAEQSGLWFIEDFSGGIGGEFAGQKLGTFGNISTTNFGSGGLVLTDSPMLNLIVLSLCDMGKTYSPNKQIPKDFPEDYNYRDIYSHLGYNLKATDLQATLAMEQLKNLPQIIEKKQETWNRLCYEFLKIGLDKWFIVPTHYTDALPNPAGFLITIKSNAKFSRQELSQYLDEQGIGTEFLFGGNLSKHPAFIGKGRIADTIPKSDFIMTNSFFIGCHPDMGENEINHIVSAFMKFVEINDDTPE